MCGKNIFKTLFVKDLYTLPEGKSGWTLKIFIRPKVTQPLREVNNKTYIPARIMRRHSLPLQSVQDLLQILQEAGVSV